MFGKSPQGPLLFPTLGFVLGQPVLDIVPPFDHDAPEQRGQFDIVAISPLRRAAMRR